MLPIFKSNLQSLAFLACSMNLQKISLSILAVVSRSRLQTAAIDDKETVTMLLSRCLVNGETLNSLVGNVKQADDTKSRWGTY